MDFITCFMNFKYVNLGYLVMCTTYSSLYRCKILVWVICWFRFSFNDFFLIRLRILLRWRIFRHFYTFFVRLKGFLRWIDARCRSFLVCFRLCFLRCWLVDNNAFRVPFLLGRFNFSARRTFFVDVVWFYREQRLNTTKQFGLFMTCHLPPKH